MPQDKLTAVRIKQQNGQYGPQIPVGAKAENVKYDNMYSVKEVLGNVKTNVGPLQEQIDNIDTEAISGAVTDWLEDNPGALLPTDKTLSIADAPADAQQAGKVVTVNSETDGNATKLHLNTTNNTVNVALMEDLDNLSDAIAEEFATNKAYAIGQYVFYDGNLYKFTAAHSAGAWNSSQVTQVKIGDEVTNIVDGISKVEAQITKQTNDIGVILSPISDSEIVSNANLICITSNGQSIVVTPSEEITIKHFGKNIYPYSADIPHYTYAWSRINTLVGMANPVFLKGGYSYIISTDKNQNETKNFFVLKAAKTDGTWITDNTIIDFHNGAKTSRTAYQSGINAFTSSSDFNNNGVAFISPTVDVYIDIVTSTTNTLPGKHPMIEVSNAVAASEYEPYTLIETKTISSETPLIPQMGTNVVYSESGMFDAEYYVLHDAKTDINNIEKNIDVIYNGDYTRFLAGKSSGVQLNKEIGTVIDLSPLQTVGTAHYSLLIEDVVPGEYFQINATDGSASRPWAFLDNDNKLLSVAYDAYANNITIKAPENTTKLLVQVGGMHLTNAYVIRASSLSFLSTGTSIEINEINDQYSVTEKLENAVSIRKGDYNTVVKNREDLFTLLHFSDIHGNTVNIQRVLYFAEKYNKYIMDIIHTGDAPITYYSDTNPFSLIGGNEIMEVVGNHECWIQGETWPRPYTATEAQVYEKYFAPYIASWDVESAGENKCYYYKDYTTAKIRLIVLDAIHYDSTQETWFSSILADAITNNLRVVAVTHYPAMTGLTNIDCTFGTYGESINAQTPPTGTDQVERMPESAFTAVDTFINNGGEFVCWLSGHTHGDFIGTVTNHSNQIQIIITTGKAINGNGDAARVNGTKTQDAFNVFVVDGVNKLIKLIRIGASMDRYMRSRETLCINYNTKMVISNH